MIEPTDPQTIYVPYYDPAVVYGAWPYPSYPPYYWPHALLAVCRGRGIARGPCVRRRLCRLGAGPAGGDYWGGGVNWGGNNININRPVNINNINAGGNNWNHNPDHRHGVRYNNNRCRQQMQQGQQYPRRRE